MFGIFDMERVCFNFSLFVAQLLLFPKHETFFFIYASLCMLLSDAMNVF